MNAIPAGFPSPAEDFLEKNLNLNEYIIEHPSATFFVRVTGNSMQGAGIFSGDILVVDKSLKAVHGSVIVAVLDGGFTVKRLCIRGKRVFLAPESKIMHEIEVTNNESFDVWGVVTFVIHKMR